jgi:hypothetical protein
MNCNVRANLENLLDEQMNRIVADGSIDKENFDEIMQDLRDNQLMPDQLDSELASKLKELCMWKNEEVSKSPRLDGYGLSVEYITTVMDRLLKAKLSELATVLRTRVHMKKKK